MQQCSRIFDFNARKNIVLNSNIPDYNQSAALQGFSTIIIYLKNSVLLIVIQKYLSKNSLFKRLALGCYSGVSTCSTT
ncbi:hypothetical protein BpHYR1_041827 [Brachionus plicatilis]|uniref:Uncharacterized protein n=1 Tax=Brachionus plicatilis TaxID=10195 RepID=A0A3M7PYP2_BRAPC|nr:hypothetical protein BpHYR1_041827 [Brachionus plicatilis]